MIALNLKGDILKVSKEYIFGFRAFKRKLPTQLIIFLDFLRKNT